MSDFIIENGILRRYNGSDSRVTVPEGVREIGDEAFKAKFMITEVILPDGVVEIGKDAFVFCSDLADIRLPEGLLHLHDNAFSGCTHLTEVAMPESVVSIGSRAFDRCDRLKSIYLPSAIAEIGKAPFSLCHSLSEIRVSDNNPFYRSIDGILYSKDAKKLICYPIGRTDEEFTVPSAVKKFYLSAFSFCKYLKTLTIPDSATVVAPTPLFGCIKLKTVFAHAGMLGKIGKLGYPFAVACLNGCLIRYSKGELSETDIATLKKHVLDNFLPYKDICSDQPLYIKFAVEQELISIDTARKWLTECEDTEARALLLNYLNQRSAPISFKEEYGLQ